MERITTKTSLFGAALALAAVLLAMGAGGLKAQNPWPDYDFKLANADGDTLYYRITSSTAPYTVAVTRCHDSVYHTLLDPQVDHEVGQPGFLYPVYDYDSLITIPSTVNYGGQTYTVNSIDKEAFYMQKDMHTVVLPASIETIDTGAFHRSTLHQIVMSPNVKRINYYAFKSTPLESVDLPSELIHIGEEAFSWTSLNQTEIPSGVNVLPYKAFYKCPLTKITLHEGLQEIGWQAFSPNYIDSLVFPGSLRKILLGDPYNYWDDSVFCRYVKFQNSPNPLELGDYCFSGFVHLETLILSDNITRIGKSCFEGTGIQSVVVPPLVDTIPEFCFAGCHYLSSVTLPQQLSVIEMQAFVGTPSLTEISFPASLTTIGRNAFSMSGVRVINCYGIVPPSIVGDGNSSFNHQDTVYVHVPCGHITTYQSAPGWSFYNNFVYDDCLGIADNESSSLKIWPNPAKNILHIECSESNRMWNIEIYDTFGHRIVGKQKCSSSTAFDISSLASGTYLLVSTNTKGHKFYKKFLKR